MAKDADTAADPVPVAPSPAQTFAQTVDEFCTELSKTDKRPELLYAFSKDEAANGRVRDLAANFQSRYEAFANRPV